MPENHLLKFEMNLKPVKKVTAPPCKIWDNQKKYQKLVKFKPKKTITI